MSTVVLEVYLYVGESLHSLCGFNILCVRIIFSTDTCHLFPQHVLAIIPLIGGVQRQCLLPAPGALGSHGGLHTLPEPAMAAEAA